MANINPYRIFIPQDEIEGLHEKLFKSRFPDSFAGGWECGVPLDDMKRVSKYWREEFSWPAFEDRLNQLPQFEATISLDGFDPFQVHFIHQQSSLPEAIPLIFIHGWPGSYYEVTKLLPLLADCERSDGLGFHVVAPSLPNFGFSSRIDDLGFGLRQYAETCHQLMLGLGYEKYAAQGGDWGSSIALSMGNFHPESVRAMNLNLITGAPPPVSSPIAFIRFLVTHFLNLYTPQETDGLKAAKSYREQGTGYVHIQKTRPNTIGIALADSPIGLLAWIYEKLVSWTDNYPWTDQEVCEWVSLYWLSRAGPAASAMIYYEGLRGDWCLRPGISAPGVKMGLSYFPKELFSTPRAWNRRLGDVIFEREHDRGGHFAAWEQPEALVGDLRIMFGPGGGAADAFSKMAN